MDTVFIFIVVLCSCELVTSIVPLPAVSSTNEELNREAKASSLINKIIDLTLKTLSTKTIEPITLQDEIKNFTKKTLIFTIKGQLILNNGKLWGVKNIRRVGDAKFHMDHLMEFEVNSTFGFDKLNFIYDYQAILFNMHTCDGQVDGNISQLIVDAGLYINLKKKTVDLIHVKLVDAKSLELGLNCIKILDKFINLILRLVMPEFKEIILFQINKELQRFLNQEIHFDFLNDQ